MVFLQRVALRPMTAADEAAGVTPVFCFRTPVASTRTEGYTLDVEWLQRNRAKKFIDALPKSLTFDRDFWALSPADHFRAFSAAVGSALASLLPLVLGPVVLAYAAPPSPVPLSIAEHLARSQSIHDDAWTACSNRVLQRNDVFESSLLGAGSLHICFPCTDSAGSLIDYDARPLRALPHVACSLAPFVL